MYTNDQLISINNNIFFYTDDSAITVQKNKFEIIKEKHYYTGNNDELL